MRILAERLRKDGLDVVVLKYPIYQLEPTGPFLDKILRSKKAQKISEEELQMWFTLNRYQFQPQVKKWLQECKIILAEDYTGTGLAWGNAKGADMQWLMSLNQYLMKEDLALLLLGNRTLMAKEKNHIHESNDALVERTGRILQKLAQQKKWKKIQLEKRIPDTAEKIYKLVRNFLNS